MTPDENPWSAPHSIEETETRDGPDGAHCPACGVDIGLLPTISAGLPTLIRCPKCRVALRYRDSWDVFAVSLVAMGVCLAGCYLAFWQLGTRWGGWAAIPLVPIWAVIEWRTAAYLRQNKVLAARLPREKAIGIDWDSPEGTRLS